jgi:hypothetical protein
MHSNRNTKTLKKNMHGSSCMMGKKHPFTASPQKSESIYQLILISLYELFARVKNHLLCILSYSKLSKKQVLQLTQCSKVSTLQQQV